MDTFQTRPSTTTQQTITPREAIALVQELASADYGPIGIMNFEFIPLRESYGGETNWDLAFRAAPADPGMLTYRRRLAIQRAIAEVRATHPMIRWP